MTPTRRHVLGSIATAGGVTLAGCLGDDESGDDTAEPDESDTPAERRLDDLTLSSSFPLELYEPGTENRLAEVHWHDNGQWSHWHNEPLEIPLEEWATVEMRLWDTENERIPLGADEQYWIEFVRTEGTRRDLLESEISGDQLDLRGQHTGRGEFVFQVWTETQEEPIWLSPVLQVDVREQ